MADRVLERHLSPQRRAVSDMITDGQNFRLDERSKRRTMVLVRHGETDGNVHDKAQGHFDAQLTECGKHQAQALAPRLASFDLSAVYASDLQRAVSTVAPLLSLRPELTLETRSQLREAHFGDYENTPWSTVREDSPRFFERWINWETRPDTTFPNGESHADMWQRVGGFVDELLANHREARSTILVVAHGGSLQSLMAHLLGMQIEQQWRFMFDNASITVVKEHPFMPTRWQCILFNDTNHLSDV